MENTSDHLSPSTPPERKQVRGWLSFFLFVVGFGALLTLVLTCANFSWEEYDLGLGTFAVWLGMSLDFLFALGLVALACYTIHAFLYIRPNAVFLGKLYVIVIFLSNVLLLAAGDLEDVGWGSFSQIIKALTLSTIWFLYLCFSSQVADLFPKESRKVFKRDKYIAGSLIGMPLLLILLCFLIYLGTMSGPASLSVTEGEYTDGVIAFHPQSSLTVERMDSSESIHHTFEIGDSIWGVVMGALDTDTSEKYFAECMDAWRDPTIDGYDFSVRDLDTKVINQNLLHIQSVEYITTPRLRWTFAMLFSPATGKVCVISCYASTDEENVKPVIDNLIETVRFK